MAKKILYVTYDGLTDPLGQSQVLPYLLALSQNAIEFHILSFEKKENYESQRDLITSTIRNSPIVWHPQLYHRHPPIISTMFDLWWMTYQAKALHRKLVFDGAWCRSYIPALVGLALKRKSNVPFIFDMRGFWPDERVEGGSWPQTNQVFRAVYRYFKRKEKLLLKEADHVVVLTNKAKHILENGQLHDNPMPKAISVVPCCVDSEFFNPDVISLDKKAETRSALGIESSDKVLVYAGSLGTWYMMKEMLEYFSQLGRGGGQWKFLVLTKDDPQQLIKEVRQMSINRERIVVRACQRAEMPLYLSLGDLAISFIQPVFSKQASSPTKLAEYFAMGLPVICNVGVGDVDQIVSDSGGGRMISSASEENKTGLSTPAGIRLYAIKHFSLNRGVEKYSHLISKV